MASLLKRENELGLSAEIVITGLDPRELRDIAPAVERNLMKRLRNIAKGVASQAAARVHSLSGETAAGYKVETRKGGVRIVNRTAASAILEFAAHPRCKHGESLIATLNQRYGAPGRILWAAWDAQKQVTDAEIERAVADAEAELQAKLDAT